MPATTNPDLLALATDERRDLADFLDTLEPEHWDAPSLCEGWSVHDVVGHVVSFEGVGFSGVIARQIRGIGRGGSNEVARARFATLAPADLIAYLRDHLRPSGVTAWFGGAIGLTDGLIHHQDIRRALDRPRDIPAERLVPALDFALKAIKLPSRRDVRGLRLVATDVDWVSGDGPEITGTAESLLMAIAGRPVVLPELSGSAVTTLAGRLEARANR